jgi:hypothetical protein
MERMTAPGGANVCASRPLIPEQHIMAKPAANRDLAALIEQARDRDEQDARAAMEGSERLARFNKLHQAVEDFKGEAGEFAAVITALGRELHAGGYGALLERIDDGEDIALIAAKSVWEAAIVQQDEELVAGRLEQVTRLPKEQFPRASNLIRYFTVGRLLEIKERPVVPEPSPPADISADISRTQKTKKTRVPRDPGRLSRIERALTKGAREHLGQRCSLLEYMDGATEGNVDAHLKFYRRHKGD